MTEQRVTLQHAAEHFDVLAAESFSSAWKGINAQQAAICRAAQTVVDIVDELDDNHHERSGAFHPGHWHGSLNQLWRAIAAFHKAERGEP